MPTESDRNSDIADQETAAMAVEALTAAQRKARDSGQPVVVVEGRDVVRVSASGRTLLKRLPPRLKVTDRTKRARS